MPAETPTDCRTEEGTTVWPDRRGHQPAPTSGTNARRLAMATASTLRTASPQRQLGGDVVQLCGETRGPAHSSDHPPPGGVGGCCLAAGGSWRTRRCRW